MKAIELEKILIKDSSIKIFDIRNKQKYDICHLTNAINIEKGLLISSPEKYLSKNEKAYIVCNSGNSSNLTTDILKGFGYSVESVDDGMNPFVINFMHKEKHFN